MNLKKGEKIIQFVNIKGILVILTNRGRLIRFELKYLYPEDDTTQCYDSLIFDNKIKLTEEITLE